MRGLFQKVSLYWVIWEAIDAKWIYQSTLFGFLDAISPKCEILGVDILKSKAIKDFFLN